MSEEPGNGASRLGRWIRARLPGVLVEVVSVVFAVLVALGVDEWRDNRELDQRASAARSAVLAEVRANRSELERTEGSMEAMVDSLAAGIARIHAGGAAQASLRINFDLPDFSDAAWRILQGSEAASHLDLDWLIRVSHAYELQESYDGMRQDVVRTMANINSEDPRTVFPRLRGELGILLQYHDQLDAKYSDILGTKEDAP